MCSRSLHHKYLQQQFHPVEAVDVNVSPSVNLFETLSVPEFLYFTNKVSGSVLSVADTFITSATTTPEVPPVTVLPVKFANVPVKDVSFTASYNLNHKLIHQITIAPCLNIWSPIFSI